MRRALLLSYTRGCAINHPTIPGPLPTHALYYPLARFPARRGPFPRFPLTSTTDQRTTGCCHPHTHTPANTRRSRKTLTPFCLAPPHRNPPLFPHWGPNPAPLTCPLAAASSAARDRLRTRRVR